jgi:C_GCAxxG_C_C family probable redox protein
MSEAFSGGIGHKFGEGTCGALTGAIAALGFYASGDKEKHLRLAAEVYDEFKKQQGTISCGDIYARYHFDHCDGCNLCAIQKVIEVLYREGDIMTGTIAPWQQTLVEQIQKEER